MFDKIKKHAMENPQQECCGFVAFKDGSSVASLLKETNIAENPKNSFRISESSYVQHLRDGHQIIAIYHSHVECDSQLSPQDLSLSYLINLPIYVYSVVDDKLNYNRPHQAIPEFADRRFVEEIQDCKILVQDYWRKELGIILKPFATRRSRITEGMTDLVQYCEENDLIQVPYPDKNHIVMMSDLSSRIPNHCGVMVDEIFMLHQPAKELSRVEPLQPYESNVICYLKHREL